MAKTIHVQVKTLVNLARRLDELGATLHNAWYRVRLGADMMGDEPNGRLLVDANAMSSAMGYFAAELEGARASVERMQNLVAQAGQRHGS